MHIILACITDEGTTTGESVYLHYTGSTQQTFPLEHKAST